MSAVTVTVHTKDGETVSDVPRRLLEQSSSLREQLADAQQDSPSAATISISVPVNKDTLVLLLLLCQLLEDHGTSVLPYIRSVAQPEHEHKEMYGLYSTTPGLQPHFRRLDDWLQAFFGMLDIEHLRCLLRAVDQVNLPDVEELLFMRLHDRLHRCSGLRNVYDTLCAGAHHTDKECVLPALVEEKVRASPQAAFLRKLLDASTTRTTNLEQ